MAAEKNYAYHLANSANGGNGYAKGGGREVDPARGDNDGCCGISCLKFSLSLFNVLFFTTGLILVAVGLWTVLEKHPSLVLLTSGLYDLTGYVIIVAGCVILCTTFVGCFGLSRNSRKTVLAYSALLAIIFVVEVGAGMLAYFYRGKLSLELADNLGEKFSKEYGIDNDTTVAVDTMQITMQCCGVNYFEDWQDTAWWNLPSRRNNKVPDSCCISPGRYCGVRSHPSNIRYTGCTDRIQRIAGDHLIIVGAVALGIALVQIVGTILACFLHCKLRDLTHYG